jgi:hypothetical protein
MATDQQRVLYIVLSVLLLLTAVAGLILDGQRALTGFVELQIHPARLLSDFTLIAGAGAALLNATLVAGLGLLIVRLTGIRLSGPTIAGVFTMLGFGLFGKTVVNVIPILVGVGLAARLAGQHYRDYILMALFGTALGPLVTAVAFELGLPVGVSLLVASAAGIVIGGLLPALAIATLRLHQGYHLYNVGLTAGLLGIFAAAVIDGLGVELGASLFWDTEPGTVLVLLVPVYATVLAVLGLATSGWAAFGEFRAILKRSGRLPSDFMSMDGTGGALLNMAVMGVMTWAYVLLVDGPLNGPVLGGVLTAMGFASFGKHPANGLPVMAGAVLATLLFGISLTDPGPLLGALFVLTLAPLAGEFGWPVGLVAGALHLALVQQTGSWHLGMNLYNNGLAGGLTATLVVAVVDWFQNTRSRSIDSFVQRSKQ